MSITVLLADDQPLLRKGFRMVPSAEPDLQVLGEAGDGAEAMRLTRALDPDILLMDIRMPRVDGLLRPPGSPDLLTAVTLRRPTLGRRPYSRAGGQPRS